MLATSNVAVQFGAKPLFEQVTVKFSDGNRYGLIGANGSGKSTLMKVLGGDLEASAGDVMLQAGMRLGKLNQNQFGYEDERVLDVVMRGHTELWAAMQERDRIYADPNATDEDYMKAAELEGVFAEYGGYDAEARAGSILTDAGIDETRHNGPMREVPPGLKLRVLLAQALFSKPDVLLLDEPTNNLDINSIRWLEGALNTYDATMVIISHDRHFLNQVCTHVADLDFQQLKIYPGNYDDFMLASVQARARVEAANAKAKDRISDLQEFVRRFSANASKARQATSRKRQLEKIKIEEIRPSSRQNPYIRFEQGKKLYRSALSVEKLSFTYPDSNEKVFENITFNVEGGERVAIIGPNGAGKTTLMRCLAGELRPTSGKIVWVENAQPGYMPQDPQAEFEDKTDLFSWMSQYTGKADDDQIVRATLGRLLFSGDDTKKSVKVLSGGEKGRMIYGKLILTKPNVLLMDEPTNHMDMETIESLQIGLEHYEGTLVFVSHDREFVAGLATRIIELRPGAGIVDFRGTYDEYLKTQELTPDEAVVWGVACVLSALLTACGGKSAAAPAPTTDYLAFGNATQVTINGYSGDAMEPFISKDGLYLFFNSRNDSAINTDIFYASRIDDSTFNFEGPIAGLNSQALDAVPSVDNAGDFYFVSTRSYASTLSTIYTAHFAGGTASNVSLVAGVSQQQNGMVNFDAEISGDGQTLWFDDGTYSSTGALEAASIAAAQRRGDGFVRRADNDNVLAAVNTAGLNYAPCISEDGLELLFTRIDSLGSGSQPAIYRATRSSTTSAFEPPQHVAAATGFVEAPTLSADGHSLYFHKMLNGLFVIFRAVR